MLSLGQLYTYDTNDNDDNDTPMMTTMTHDRQIMIA